MTNTPSARQQIADTAAANGWTKVDYVVGNTVGLMVDRYYWGDVTVTVSLTRTGRLRGADRVADGQQPQVTGARGKRETVIGWLVAQPSSAQR